jgi:hypothetical protein
VGTKGLSFPGGCAYTYTWKQITKCECTIPMNNP